MNQNHSSIIDIIAVLYNYLANGYEMLSTELIDKYEQNLKENLMLMKSEKGKSAISDLTSSDNYQSVFYRLKDQYGNSYSVLRPRFFTNINGEYLHEIYEEHLRLQSKELITASLATELLTIIGVFDSTNIIDFLTDMGFFKKQPKTKIIKFSSFQNRKILR